jgi:hypothetical protein
MLSDNQRRTICRVVFLAGCVTPTIAVLYTIFHRPTADDWARNIKAELGVEASIEGLDTPIPGVTILRGVRLFDPEAGPLIEATEVAIEMTRIQNRVVIGQHLSLTRSGLTKLIELVNENPLRRHDIDRPWQLYCNGLATIYDTSASLSANQQLAQTLTIENTHVWMQPLQGGTELQIRFQVAEEPRVLAQGQHPAPQPTIKGYLARNKAWDAGFNQLFAGLDTDGVALPCWLVEELTREAIPEMRSLGTEVQFKGIVEYASNNGQPGIKIQGRFSQLDGSFYRDGHFDGIELICEYSDRRIKNWDATLLNPDYRVPVPQIEIGQPHSIEYAIRVAQQQLLRADNTFHR